jgi:anti-anti-sigma regulatory factor
MLVLPFDFDNSAAVQFFDQVRALDVSADVTVDAGQVVKISTLAVQTLLALEKSLKDQGHALKVEPATRDFKDTLHDLGLDEALSRWSQA